MVAVNVRERLWKSTTLGTGRGESSAGMAETPLAQLPQLLHQLQPMIERTREKRHVEEQLVRADLPARRNIFRDLLQRPIEDRSIRASWRIGNMNVGTHDQLHRVRIAPGLLRH